RYTYLSSSIATWAAPQPRPCMLNSPISVSDLQGRPALAWHRLVVVGDASWPNAFEEDDALPVQHGAPLWLAAELVPQGSVGLAKEGAFDHHIAKALDLRRLVLIAGEAPVGGRERVGKFVDVAAVGEVGGQVVLGADRGGRVDEAECLAAGIVDRPGVGRTGEVLGPRRRPNPVVDEPGHGHQGDQQAGQDHPAAGPEPAASAGGPG